MRRVLLFLTITVLLLTPALPVQASEAVGAPEGGNELYDDGGSQQYCGNSSVPSGYHCQRCSLNYDPDGDPSDFAKCIDIDNTGGSGYYYCRVIGSECNVNNGCNVTIVN